MAGSAPTAEQWVKMLYPHRRQRPGPAGLGAAPRPLQAGRGLRRQVERRFGPSLSGASSLAGILQLPLRETESVMLPRRKSWEGEDPKRQRDPSDRVLRGSRAPWDTRGKEWVCDEWDLSMRYGCDGVAQGARSSGPLRHTGTPVGWAGHTGARQSLTQSRLLLPTHYCHSPNMQQGCGRGTRATQRCSTRPIAQMRAAAEQLFPAVITGLQPWQGLWVTRCVLTSSCALTKALYPQAKTSTLAISKSNITVTIIIFKLFCCCCCCCYEHRSSIQLSWFWPKLATGARGNLWHVSRMCFSKGVELTHFQWFQLSPSGEAQVCPLSSSRHTSAPAPKCTDQHTRVKHRTRNYDTSTMKICTL